MHKEKEKIIIVGGIGGLVSSLLLSDKSLEVIVVDKNKEVGGKLGLFLVKMVQLMRDLLF